MNMQHGPGKTRRIGNDSLDDTSEASPMDNYGALINQP